MRSNHQALLDQINESGDWNDELEAGFKKAVESFKSTGSW